MATYELGEFFAVIRDMRQKKMKSNTKSERVTLTGVVAPAAWDEDFKVTSVMIATNLEEDFIIENNAKGRKLFNFLQESIQVVGVVKEDDLGNKVISVKKYTLIGPSMLEIEETIA